jgi:cyclopropane-fatty-acyl-phospholipid synthase
VAVMRSEAARAGLSMRTALSFGASYARTLAEWRGRFLASWPAIEALGFDASFRRLWEYYLCYCEAGFRSGKIDVGLYTLEHAGSATDPSPILAENRPSATRDEFF